MAHLTDLFHPSGLLLSRGQPLELGIVRLVRHILTNQPQLLLLLLVLVIMLGVLASRIPKISLKLDSEISNFCDIRLKICILCSRFSG